MGYELQTKNGYSLYEMSSMIQKAIRRSDIPHAAYAANELSVKYRKYLWKRLLTVSAEDCYGIMTKEIIALKEADDFTNKGAKPGDTNDVFIAKAVVLLCMARKNRDADYVACNFMWGDRPLTDKEYEEFVDYQEVERLKNVKDFEVPDYVYDVHTRQGKSRGATEGQFFKEENDSLKPKQMSLFDFGDFGGYYDHKRAEGRMSASDRRDEEKLKAGGRKTDPTEGGKVWTEEIYRRYQ